VLATVSEIRQDSPSVCLGDGNPNRLVSLLDIVNKVDVIRLMVMTHCLSSSQAQMDYLSRVGGGAEPVPSDQHETIMDNVRNAMELCKSNGFLDAAMKISNSVREFQKRTMNIACAATELRNIHEAIFADSMKQWFIKVSPALSPWLTIRCLLASKFMMLSHRPAEILWKLEIAWP
jgi:hypothetical protein